MTNSLGPTDDREDDDLTYVQVTCLACAQAHLVNPNVRLQMVWDNLSCLGTEALARLGLRLGGFQLMFQSSLSDGVAFDPFSFQKDGSASAEVDVGRCQVL